MAEYKVGHDYRAVYRARPLAFTEGAKVEVDDETAEWVNNDSPGTLVAASAKAKSEPKKSAEPEPKAQRGRSGKGRSRGGSVL